MKAWLPVTLILAAALCTSGVVARSAGRERSSPLFTKTFTKNSTTQVCALPPRNAKRVDLGNCRIEAVREGFIRVPEAEELNLASNQIEHVDPAAFEGLLQLRQLSLDNNIHLIIRNDTFIRSRSLELLSLRNCSLGLLDVASFTAMPALKILNLSVNPGCEGTKAAALNSSLPLHVICHEQNSSSAPIGKLLYQRIFKMLYLA